MKNLEPKEMKLKEKMEVVITSEAFHGLIKDGSIKDKEDDKKE